MSLVFLNFMSLPLFRLQLPEGSSELPGPTIWVPHPRHVFLVASGVRPTDGRLCFERARLQSCRKRPKTSWALAPEGSFLYEFNPFTDIGK